MLILSYVGLRAGAVSLCPASFHSFSVGFYGRDAQEIMCLVEREQFRVTCGYDVFMVSRCGPS